MSKKMVLSKFMILCCWAIFIAILGCMWPVGCGVDTPGTPDMTLVKAKRTDSMYSRNGKRNTKVCVYMVF